MQMFFSLFDKIATNRAPGRLSATCFLVIFLLWTCPSIAQQHSYDPNTDNDSGQELTECGPDITKYCKFWSPLLFELENCLQSHMETLRPACRTHLQTTDFRRYHTGQDPSSGF